MLRGYHEVLEADLAERGTDLLDLYRGTLSPRRLMVLIRQLPRESRFQHALDPDGTQWGDTDHLIADLIDVTIAAAGGKRFVDRPGQEKAREAIREARRSRWDERHAAREQSRREAAAP